MDKFIVLSKQMLDAQLEYEQVKKDGKKGHFTKNGRRIIVRDRKQTRDKTRRQWVEALQKQLGDGHE